MMELTWPMIYALRYMKAYDGKLRRFPGGFWATGEGWRARGEPDFPTVTIEALVRRGLAEYTEWKDGRNGRFPVAVALRVVVAGEAAESQGGGVQGDRLGSDEQRAGGVPGRVQGGNIEACGEEAVDSGGKTA